MTIGQYRGIMRQAVNSGTRRNGGVPPPPYGDYHFLTKTAPAMSEDEYREAIIEQAKKDQSEGKFQTQSASYKKLMKSYVSVVSPDRRATINEGLPLIFKNMKRQPQIDLLDVWLGGDNGKSKFKYNKLGDILLYAEFHDCNGNFDTAYANGEWKSYGTEAEFSRQSEFLSIYNKAWGDAARAANSSPPETGAPAPDGGGEGSMNLFA